MTERPIAYATCALCSHVAQLTGDTEAEITDTLRRMLLAHLITEHPEVESRARLGHVVILYGTCRPFTKPEAYG